MGWESHHSRSTHPRHLGQHSANLSPATPMCLLSSPDSDLFLSAQGAGFNRPYTLNNYLLFTIAYFVADLPKTNHTQQVMVAAPLCSRSFCGPVPQIYRNMKGNLEQRIGAGGGEVRRVPLSPPAAWRLSHTIPPRPAIVPSRHIRPRCAPRGSIPGRSARAVPNC